MVEYYKLDKVFVQGANYQLPNDRFYIIRKIGTDADSDTYLKIDGVDTGAIISDIAPLHKTSSNLLGPLDLKDLFYVVPPNKVFTVEGPSGAKVRCIGEIGKLAPGEAIPGNFASRFTDQGKHFLTYQSGTATLAAAGGSWAADAENSVIELTPKTIETVRFNNVLMGKVENSAAAIADGQVAIRIYLEGTPLDILTAEPGMKGIDILACPYPPADGTEEEPFSLEDRAIEVLGDRTVKLTVMNVSGAAISASTAADMTATITAVVEFLKKE